MHSDPDISEFACFADHLADLAGDIARRYFRTSHAVFWKQDASPIVTVADREIETVLRHRIYTEYPQHGVLGEEFEAINSGSPWQWVLDPIDGTISFESGKPLFGVLIALMVDGVPVLGVIDQPIMAERWVGIAGSETTMNKIAVRCRQHVGLADASVGINGAERFASTGLPPELLRVWNQARYCFFGGDCYNFALLASGLIDVVIELEPDLHDIASVVPVVAGAGGCVTDWNGHSIRQGRHGGVIAAGSANLHREVLDSINDR